MTGTTSCRDRQRQVLAYLDEHGSATPEQLMRVVEETTCSLGHGVRFAELMQEGVLETCPDESLRLGQKGEDWLLTHGRPAPDWQQLANRAGRLPPLRQWQVEALDSWAAHGHQGVVEAVTGTGKSRVGIEAIREALEHDFSVVVCVPTIDLVQQWKTSLREHGIGSVGVMSSTESSRGSFRSHSVLVATVQLLYGDPPTRPDGKVLLVADECHRYGAAAWGRALDRTYVRRLGLTATFERNDDGINHLLDYFGGGPVFEIGFERAISEGVVAPYDVRLMGVELTRNERLEYDEADEIVKDCRMRLVLNGLPEEPFGEFMYEVTQVAEDEGHPEDRDLARQYLKAFSQRIDVLSNAQKKYEWISELATAVQKSRGAIVFTRRVDAAEQISAELASGDVAVEAVHSGLSRAQRRDRLGALRRGRLQAVVAPTVLDEGIDVPDVDLGVVMGGSKSRRQMIQRMGRVLRLKADGRKATFVIVYAKNTVEDVTEGDGVAGCLDLLVDTADSVGPWGAQPHPQATQPDRQAAAARQVTGAECATVVEPDMPLPRGELLAPTVTITRDALEAFQRHHDLSDEVADRTLRCMLQAFTDHAERWEDGDQIVLGQHGYEVMLSTDLAALVDYWALVPDPWVGVTASNDDEDIAGSALGDRDPIDTSSDNDSNHDAEPSVLSDEDESLHQNLSPSGGEQSLVDGWVDELERLARLHEAGMLDEDEFRVAKYRVLYGTRG